jgi:hypothetical protein
MTNPLRIRTRVDSETLHLPELRALIGKDVEIIVIEDAAASGNGRPGAVHSIEQLRSALPGDPFGATFDETLRAWRDEPWSADEPEGPK